MQRESTATVTRPGEIVSMECSHRHLSQQLPVSLPAVLTNSSPHSLHSKEAAESNTSTGTAYRLGCTLQTSTFPNGAMFFSHIAESPGTRLGLPSPLCCFLLSCKSHNSITQCPQSSARALHHSVQEKLLGSTDRQAGWSILITKKQGTKD